MAASQNNLSLVLNQQDSVGVNILNRSIGAISYAGIVGQLVDGLLTVTSLVAQTLPTANVLQFYFKNTHSTAVITITATVQGGASQVIAKVQPGGVFVYWAPVTSATAGYTTIAFTSDTVNATYETFMGG